MSVKIHGKEYRTVAERVNLFHEENQDVKKSIKTKILSNQDNKVIMQAVIIAGVNKYVGHAEEVYDSSMINKTSALENCETSAIGRALASAGFGGTEFASADEVANAISQQNSISKSPAAQNGSSTNGQAEKNEPYVHSDEMRDSAIGFGKHKGMPWRELPKDYVTWLSNNSDNAKWQMMAMGEITARASDSLGLNKEMDKQEEESIQHEMQLSAEPNAEQEEDDALPF